MTYLRQSQLTGRARLRGLASDTRAAGQDLAHDRQRFAALAGDSAAPVVIQADLLFPTPPDLAARVAELADIRPGDRVLEPSAGTGNLLAAIGDASGDAAATAVEIVPALAEVLRRRFPAAAIRCGDFLAADPSELGQFDRIIMNPPFRRGLDIKHVLHARKFLKPGGRLVAICYNGDKQRRAFQLAATDWIDLQAGSFRASGTDVAAAICVFEGSNAP